MQGPTGLNSNKRMVPFLHNQRPPSQSTPLSTVQLPVGPFCVYPLSGIRPLALVSAIAAIARQNVVTVKRNFTFFMILKVYEISDYSNTDFITPYEA
jgi:hypothetical protein